ncbi:hypothetical protein BYT27DRAFT_7249457 [Phlegmacium glaucopus]|nr:hypothetical protein BYT27DRAFT_7249457 [Phlegmacium glaucopus]
MDAPMDMDDDNEGRSVLPFPGEVVDGQQTTQYFDITAPAPRRMHRGPKAGKVAKKSSKKKSALHAEEIFKNDPTFSDCLAHLPVRLPMQAAITTPTQSEKILQWARTMSVNHPYMSKENRLEAGRARLRIAAVAARRGGVGCAPAPDPSLHTSSICLTDAQVGQLVTSLSMIATKEGPARLVSDAPMTTHHTTPMTTHHTTPIPTPIPLPLQAVDSQPHHQLVATSANFDPAAPGFNSKPATTRSITFGNGTRLEFCADDVRPPPAISFADDLWLLNEMWDDTPAYWGGHSVLNIKGVPIPIAYWKEVYARSKSGGWKPGQWKQVKGSWFEWKVIVKRWCQGSEDAFWREFSDTSGQRLTYTAIIDRLAQAQKKSDNEMAKHAKQEYGDEFSKVFCYKKNRACFVKTKACDIAKQYQRLKNITDDMDAED